VKYYICAHRCTKSVCMVHTSAGVWTGPVLGGGSKQGSCMQEFTVLIELLWLVKLLLDNRQKAASLVTTWYEALPLT